MRRGVSIREIFAHYGRADREGESFLARSLIVAAVSLNVLERKSRRGERVTSGYIYIYIYARLLFLRIHSNLSCESVSLERIMSEALCAALRIDFPRGSSLFILRIKLFFSSSGISGKIAN